MNSFMSCSFSTIIILAMKIVNGMDCNCPDLQSVTSIHPTITALPLTLPKTRVSLRNCCHRGNITTRTKPPYSAKTVQSSLYAQTAPLSHISRFNHLSLTSKPRTQHGTRGQNECHTATFYTYSFQKTYPRHFACLREFVNIFCLSRVNQKLM